MFTKLKEIKIKAKHNHIATHSHSYKLIYISYKKKFLQQKAFMNLKEVSPVG